MTDTEIFQKNLEIVQLSNSDKPIEHQYALANSLTTSKKFWHKDMLRKEPEGESDKWNSIIGLFTMSESRSNILLWSHYANCHSGFAVGFWTDSFVKSDDYGYMDAVDYYSDYPVISGMENFESQFKKRFFSKSDLWSYEMEWRITKNHIKNRKILLNENAYAEVIIGCLASEETKNKIVRVVKQQFKGAKLLIAQTHPEKFELVLREI